MMLALIIDSQYFRLRGHRFSIMPCSRGAEVQCEGEVKIHHTYTENEQEWFWSTGVRYTTLVEFGHRVGNLDAANEMLIDPISVFTPLN